MSTHTDRSSDPAISVRRSRGAGPASRRHRARPAVLAATVVLLGITSACGDDGKSATDAGPGRPDGSRVADGSTAGRDGAAAAADANPGRDGGDRGDAGRPVADVGARARGLANFLAGDAHFMIGAGNDLAGPPTYDANRALAFTLGTDLDVHYVYLVGYSDRGGWPTWNADGSFVTIHADAARRNGGVAPMFTYYQLALDYESGSDPLADAGRMAVYLADVRLLFTRLAEFGDPAAVHFEPDLYGYLQQRFDDMAATADSYVARIHVDSAPECSALPETAHGLGRCLVAMRDAIAPNVRIGLHASQWGAWYDSTDLGADVEASGRSVATFLRSMGAAEMDFVVVETLDRDAGFWEAYGGSASMCSPTDGPRGKVYWDETNETAPNFAQHFRWVRALTTELSLPAMWWQTPFGVPSASCGGSDGSWRDNRVAYFFAHIDELVAAGGAGALFGTGAGGQTAPGSDDGQFQRAVQAYFLAPTVL